MFERKWEYSFGKIGKKEFEGKALEEKTTKYPAVPSEIRTYEPRVARRTPKPLRHPETCLDSAEVKT